MPRTARSRTGQRGSRVKLGGSILALVLLENGRQIHASLSQLSTNGGLLSLNSPLDESIAVTVLFHVGITTVRCRARIMFPMWATKGCLQPFRFVDLAQETRADLARELAELVRANALQDEAGAEYNDLLLRRL